MDHGTLFMCLYFLIKITQPWVLIEVYKTVVWEGVGVELKQLRKFYLKKILLIETKLGQNI